MRGYRIADLENAKVECGFVSRIPASVVKGEGGGGRESCCCFFWFFSIVGSRQALKACRERERSPGTVGPVNHTG